MNKARFFSIVLVGFLTHQQFVFAQGMGVISGKVYVWRPETVTISLLNQNGAFIEKTSNDKNGAFIFRFVSAGNYRLKFECNYHRPFLSDIFYASSYTGKSGLSYQLQPTTSMFISWLYATMVLSPESFPKFVSDNRNLITSDRNFFSCINGATTFLRATAAREMHNQKQATKYAYDVAIKSGASYDIARKVKEDMDNTSTNPALLAEYLSAMSNFVRQILAGNSYPYYNSSIYKLTRQWSDAKTQYAPILKAAIESQYRISYGAFLLYEFFFCVDYAYLYVGTSCN